VHVHDESNEAEIGDTVTVIEIPPVSKTKAWRLVRIDERPARV
jgi:small subunit ribosomal protein S17